MKKDYIINLKTLNLILTRIGFNSYEELCEEIEYLEKNIDDNLSDGISCDSKQKLLSYYIKLKEDYEIAVCEKERKFEHVFRPLITVAVLVAIAIFVAAITLLSMSIG